MGDYKGRAPRTMRDASVREVLRTSLIRRIFLRHRPARSCHSSGRPASTPKRIRLVNAHEKPLQRWNKPIASSLSNTTVTQNDSYVATGNLTVDPAHTPAVRLTFRFGIRHCCPTFRARCRRNVKQDLKSHSAHRHLSLGSCDYPKSRLFTFFRYFRAWIKLPVTERNLSDLRCAQPIVTRALLALETQSLDRGATKTSFSQGTRGLSALNPWFCRFPSAVKPHSNGSPETYYSDYLDSRR